MHPRAVCNFVYVYLRPGRDGSAEDNEKFDGSLYAPLGESTDLATLLDEIETEEE